MSEILFPQRSRCKVCRIALGAHEGLVIMGLYCSYKCAKMPIPSPSPTHAVTPRECKTMRDGEWGFKRRYRYEAEIPERVQEDPSTSTYWCGHCGHLHVGRTVVELPRATNRGLRGRSDIADVLTKARGKATRREVAAVAGIRPIRIKEWEDDTFDNPSLDALFVLLRTYRMDLAAVFGPVRRPAAS